MINWFRILTFQKGNILFLLGKLLLTIIILSISVSGNAMALDFIIYFVIGYTDVGNNWLHGFTQLILGVLPLHLG